MKLLSFLGTGRYQPVTYTLNGMEFKTEYVAEALYHFLKPDEVIVFVTEEALEKHGQSLAGRVPVKFVSIEVPRKQEDVWGIFEAMVESVGNGENVALDITHAFRHIPFLAFPALLYLVEVKGVDVKGIYYGAFEAREETESGVEAPIFELTGLFDVIEWLYGLRDLKEYGRAEGLSGAIKRTNARIHRSGSGEKPRVLSRYSTALNDLSTLLHLNQIPAFMELAEKAGKDFGNFRNEAIRFLPPLKYGLEEVEKLVSFGCSGNCLGEGVGLAEYMLEKGLTANALELERELIVNIVLAKLGVEDHLDGENRRNAEKTLGWLSGELRGNMENLEKTKWVDELKDWEETEKLVRAWLKVTEVRNAIAHAGMKPKRDRPRPKKIVKSAHEVLRDLREIVASLGD